MGKGVAKTTKKFLQRKKKLENRGRKVFPGKKKQRVILEKDKGSDNEDEIMMKEMKDPEIEIEGEDKEELGMDIGENDMVVDIVEDEEDDDELKEHMLELEELKETDPEFWKHLQENDANLLKFGDDVLEQEIEEKKVEAQESLVEKLKKDVLEKRSCRALQRLLKAFRDACHMSDSGKQKKKNMKSQSQTEKEEDSNIVKIENAQVFHSIMHFGMMQMNDIFCYHLNI
jgi:nucleolar complex protein 2